MHISKEFKEDTPIVTIREVTKEQLAIGWDIFTHLRQLHDLRIKLNPISKE
jgi:hypothetical protein